MGSKQARIVTPDNGYFQVWEKPNGERVRVYTEDQQMMLRNPARRAAFEQATRERLSA